MKQKEPAELTDQELLEHAKKSKSTTIINAFLIGFFIGIIIYAVAKNNLGFFALFPLFFAFKVFNKSKKNKALEEQVKKGDLNK